MRSASLRAAAHLSRGDRREGRVDLCRYPAWVVALVFVAELPNPVVVRSEKVVRQGCACR